MRKSFRVATVFTGAAACAAGFTPAALAATATTTAKTQQMEPDTFHRNCPGGYNGPSTTSMHFYYPSSKDHGPTCVGQLGSTSLAGTFYEAACTGNNSGYYYTPAGRYPFDRSEVFSLSTDVFNVSILEFGGGYKCPPII